MHSGMIVSMQMLEALYVNNENTGGTKTVL